ANKVHVQTPSQEQGESEMNNEGKPCPGMNELHHGSHQAPAEVSPVGRNPKGQWKKQPRQAEHTEKSRAPGNQNDPGSQREIETHDRNCKIRNGEMKQHERPPVLLPGI